MSLNLFWEPELTLSAGLLGPKMDVLASIDKSEVQSPPPPKRLKYTEWPLGNDLYLQSYIKIGPFT